MHFVLFPAAAGPRLLLLVASFVVPFTLTSCGTNSGSPQTSSPSPQPPPPIPSAQPVLLFNGIGTSTTDVAAVEAILGSLSIAYATADSAHLNGMTEPELAGYKLLIVPGGDSTVIGGNLSPGTAANIHGAVVDYGLHYLGICAGAFFGGYSIYNGVDLTGGVFFNFYQDEFKGIHTEPVEISLASGEQLDVYWQDGPQLSGWGQVVAKFPDSTPAIVEGTSGKGFVVFTGVHLEAPASWRGSMEFSTPVSVDLAYAATVMQAAFNGTPLPRF